MVDQFFPYPRFTMKFVVHHYFFEFDWTAVRTDFV